MLGSEFGRENICDKLNSHKQQSKSMVCSSRYLQCFPGNSGLFEIISAKMHPTDQISTVTEAKEREERDFY